LFGNQSTNRQFRGGFRYPGLASGNHISLKLTVAMAPSLYRQYGGRETASSLKTEKLNHI
jgi:hypothetical protein